MRLPLTIHPKPPLVLQGALCAGHVLAFAVLWPIEMPAAMRLVGGMALLVSVLFGAMRLQKKHPRFMTLKTECRVDIETGGRSIEGRVTPGGAVTPCLVMLRLDAGGEPRTLSISSDMLEAEDYRQLCVWLRWSNPRDVAARRYS